MVSFCPCRHRLTFTNSGLTPPRFTEVPAPSHENDQSGICVIGIAICKRFKLFCFPNFQLDKGYSRKRVMRTKLDSYVLFFIASVSTILLLYFGTVPTVWSVSSSPVDTLCSYPGTPRAQGPHDSLGIMCT